MFRTHPNPIEPKKMVPGRLQPGQIGKQTVNIMRPFPILALILLLLLIFWAVPSSVNLPKRDPVRRAFAAALLSAHSAAMENLQSKFENP